MLYVESLIAEGVINTMPQVTLDAFADHGTTAVTLGRDRDEWSELLKELKRAGVSLAHVTSGLEREGVASFCASYAQLLDCIETRRKDLSELPKEGT